MSVITPSNQPVVGFLGVKGRAQKLHELYHDDVSKTDVRRLIQLNAMDKDIRVLVKANQRQAKITSTVNKKITAKERKANMPVVVETSQEKIEQENEANNPDKLLLEMTEIGCFQHKVRSGKENYI